MDEQLKQALDGIAQQAKTDLGAIKTELAKAIEGKASNETIAGLQTELKTTTEKLTEALDALKEQGMAINAMKESGTPNRRSFSSDVEKGLTSQLEELKGLQSGNSKGKVQIKAAGTILTSNILPAVATAAPYMLTDQEGGITNIMRRNPFLRQIMNVRAMGDRKYVSWAEAVNHDGGAGMTAEGVLKTQADFDIQETTAEVKKVTSYMKTSKENLDDVQEMQAAIEGELRTLVELKLDEQLLSGAGTGANLKGILEYAEDFSVTGTTLEGGIDDQGVERGNHYDVLRVARWQVAKEHFQPNYFLINPLDAVHMDLEKTTDGIYVIPPFATANGRQVAGMIGIENTGVTAGDFLVGDFSKANLRIREEINLAIGYENDDFTKNLVTILAEMRAVHYVKTNHVKAFVKGTFATAKAAILKSI